MRDNLADFSYGNEFVGIDPAAYIQLIILIYNAFPPSAINNKITAAFAMIEPCSITFINFLHRIDAFHAGDYQMLIKRRTITPFIIAADLMRTYFIKSQERLNEDGLEGAHKLFAAAFLVGLKVGYDKLYCNNFYAEVFGVSGVELKFLESTFLKAIQFDIGIPGESFSHLTRVYLVLKNSLYSQLPGDKRSLPGFNQEEGPEERDPANALWLRKRGGSY